MKNLIKYLLPFSAFFVLGQTPMAQPLRETKSSVQMESGCVYIMSPLARQPKIKPLSKDLIERCESKLDLIDLGRRTEYAFHDGSTLSGLKSSRNHPGLTLIKDNRGTNLYQEYVDGDKNGIPEMVYYNWAGCTDCISEREVASMSSGERDLTILEFQHMITYVADSTGDSSRSLLPLSKTFSHQ